jgi:23S rRNA pseudouridine1911/1915/1917 synthase
VTLNKGYEYRERIDSRSAGLKVLDYLAGNYRHSSTEEWQMRLYNGEISIDKQTVNPEFILKQGHWLVWRRPPWNEPDVPYGYAVLYEDEDLLAVGKPAGLPTIPGGGFLDHTLLTFVRRNAPAATPIHRLGRGTSGIVLFARSRHSRSHLCSAMRQCEVIKIYRALATGSPVKDEFIVQSPIGPVPHPLLGTIHSASPDGKRAISHMRVIERSAKNSILEVRILTGRPHQIRIHLAFAGFPLEGDPLFASGGQLKEPVTALPGDIGYYLHAERLCFRHPSTEIPTEIWCCPPPELRGSVGVSTGSHHLSMLPP